MWKWCLVGLAVVVGVGLQACAPQPAAEKSCNFVQNVYGERISWKGALPITLRLHSSFPQESIPALEKAISHWESALDRKLFQIESEIDYGPLSPRQDGVSTIYMMDTWEENRMSEQARTSVYWMGDQIREADIRINGKRFSFYIDMATSPDQVHLPSLLIHELGHVLGLKHNDTTESVMGTYLRSNTEREMVSVADVDNLACEY